MFGGPWDSTLIMTGVPSLKIGVQSYYIWTFREGFRTGLSCQTGVAKHQSKLGCKDQESMQSSTTPDPGYQWESDKLIVDTTKESQEVSPFPAGDHKAHINRRAQRHSKHKTEQKHKRSTKEVPPWNGQ